MWEQQYLGSMTLFIPIGVEKRKSLRLKNIAVTWTVVLSQLLFWSYLFTMTNSDFQARSLPHTWHCPGSLGTRTWGTWSPGRKHHRFPPAVLALVQSPKMKITNTEFLKCIFTYVHGDAHISKVKHRCRIRSLPHYFSSCPIFYN